MPAPQPPQQQLLPDTTAAVADTSGAVGTFSRNLTEAGQLMISGEYNVLFEKSVDLLLGFVPNLIRALVVLLLLWVGYRILHRVITGILQRSTRIDKGVQQILMKTFKGVFFAFAGVMTLNQLGIKVTALLGVLGVAGLAVSFAARDTVENFIAGVTILLDQPFRVGDNIVVDNTFGTVQEITLRSTRLLTRNYESVIIPNLQMINQKLINHTLTGPLRINIPFGIAYKEDPDEAREVVLALTEGDDRLAEGRESSVVVSDLGDSSVNMILRVWISDPRKEREIYWDYMERVFEELRAHDIEIPFPHLQLFIDGAKAFKDASFMNPRMN